MTAPIAEFSVAQCTREHAALANAIVSATGYSGILYPIQAQMSRLNDNRKLLLAPFALREITIPSTLAKLCEYFPNWQLEKMQEFLGTLSLGERLEVMDKDGNLTQGTLIRHVGFLDGIILSTEGGEEDRLDAKDIAYIRRPDVVLSLLNFHLVTDVAKLSFAYYAPEPMTKVQDAFLWDEE